MKLSEILYRRKEEMGLTYQQISDASNIPVHNLKKIFLGTTVDPQYSNLRSIVHALGMSMDELESLDDEPSSISPAALNLAARYDRLSPIGQRFIDSAMTIEEERESL